jgi:hypothetical protein
MDAIAELFSRDILKVPPSDEEIDKRIAEVRDRA